MAEHRVPGWYSQAITLAYERARGIRAVGQSLDGGWTVNATKTIAVPVERLFDAFEDAALRARWLPGASLRLRTATPPKSARYDWGDGGSRLVISGERLAETKSRLAIQHERIGSAGEADQLKAFWRERLSALKAVLEERP
jgi:hypothetical protein